MDKKTMGKTSRAAGKAFELKVRKDLEKNGWIVCKWSNNVEFNCDRKNPTINGLVFTIGKLIPAKHTFNPFTKAMSAGNGFPDFVCIKRQDLEYKRELEGLEPLNIERFNCQLVESKMNGKLDKIEKEKVEWIKDKLKIPVFVASKGEKRGEIKYEQI